MTAQSSGTFYIIQSSKKKKKKVMKGTWRTTSSDVSDRGEHRTDSWRTVLNAMGDHDQKWYHVCWFIIWCEAKIQKPPHAQRSCWSHLLAAARYLALQVRGEVIICTSGWIKDILSTSPWACLSLLRQFPMSSLSWTNTIQIFRCTGQYEKL